MKSALAIVAFFSAFLGTPAAYGATQAATKNDAFVPIAEAAARLLAEGDLALYRARAKESGELTPEALRKTFESWRRALTAALDRETSGSERVPCRIQPAEAATAEERAALEALAEEEGNAGLLRLEDRTEPISVAVLRRLSTLNPSEREAWTARFEPLAETELRAAGTESRLARIEAEFPRTTSAARAALRLGDLAFERGRPEEARAWLQRAAQHGSDSLLSEAVRRRKEVLDALDSSAGENSGGSWRTATRLSLVDEIDLGLRRTRFQDERLGFSRGVLPGTVLLEDDVLAVQFPDAILLLEEGRTRALFDPRALLVDFESVRVGPSFAPAGSAWPLRPAATDDGDLILVLGRALAGGSSCLLRVTPPSPALTLDTTEVQLSPELRWAVTPRGRIAPDDSGAMKLQASKLPDGIWEFQPGPLLSDDRIYCQARRWDEGESGEPLDLARPEAWLLVFDARNGEFLRSRFLAKGTDVHRDPGRFQEARVITPAQPPALVPGGLLCGTGIGVAALVSAGDLRVQWTFKLGLRDPDDAGWAAFDAPPVVTDGESGYALVGAMESDRLYALRYEADTDNRGLLAHPPQPIGEARAITSADPGGSLHLGLRGARRTMFRLEWTADKPRRIDAVDARADERLRGRGLASESRAYFATDKTLYLFDRTADLRLIETIPLLLGGGVLTGIGDLVYVASEGGITILRAE